MPRKKIEIPETIEHLSILAEDGSLDKKLEPDLSDEFLLKIHRMMLLSRRFDERMLKLQRMGRIGTFAPVKGQEASQLGIVAAMRDSDWMVPSFRETTAYLWRDTPMENILLTFGGYYQGNEVSSDSTNLLVSVPVGTQPLHAVGIGYGIKYDGKDDVVATFFGDGATSEGDFHEAMNMAGVYQVPVLFVCQNNQWAISIPREKQTRAKTIAQKAVAYGIPGIQVDGNDILAMYVAAQEAVERARSGGGPTLIEAVTYRLSVHTTADDPSKYRNEEEVKEWEKKDPLPRFNKYLIGKGVLTEERLEELEEEVKEEIRQAVDKAETQMEELSGEALTMFDHLYEEMPPYLKEQRQELKEELAQQEGSNG